MFHDDKWVTQELLWELWFSTIIHWSGVAELVKEENTDINYTLPTAKPELGKKDGQENKHKVMLCTEPILDVSLANSLWSADLQRALYLAICPPPHVSTVNQLSPSCSTEIMTKTR